MADMKPSGLYVDSVKDSLTEFSSPAQIVYSPKLARRTHDDALVVDTHNDVLLNTIDSTTWLPAESIGAQLTNGYQHLDIPKMQAGGLDVAFFAAYTPGDVSWERSNSRILALINALHWNARVNKDTFAIATSSREIIQYSKAKKVGVLAIEGAYSLEECNYRELLQQYYDLGVRLITLCWSNSNSLGEGERNVYVDGTPSSGGLTALGAKVIKEMERLGIIVDVSHMNVETFWGVAEAAKGAIIASHSCVSAIHNVPRNLNDNQIKAIAKSGGVVQINFYPAFLGPDGKNGLAELVNHIDYVVRLAGDDYVGLGSDFDGAEMPADIPNASYCYRITEQLLGRGYSKESIEKILGLNIMRVMKDTEAKAKLKENGDAASLVIVPELFSGDGVSSLTPLYKANVLNNGTSAKTTRFLLFVDGIEYTPLFDPVASVLSYQMQQPMMEKFHVVTFVGCSIEGMVTRETRIFYIDVAVN